MHLTRGAQGQLGLVMAMLPITDSHQHLWDRARLELPWLRGMSALNRDFKMPDYLRACQGQGVHRSVYVEVDVVAEQRWLEVELVAELCAKPNLPVCAMVAAADPLSADFEEHIQRLLSVHCVRGVRCVLHTNRTPPGHCSMPEFVAGVKRLGQLGLSFDLCVRSDEVEDAARLVERCPETQFIIDHCGNADPVAVQRWKQAGALGDEAGALGGWARGMQQLAELPNVVCKLSGVVASLPPGLPMEWLAATFDVCLDWFGSDRILIGSDWPVCTLRAELGQWLSVARGLIASRSEVEQRRILDENAARVYRLE